MISRSPGIPTQKSGKLPPAYARCARGELGSDNLSKCNEETNYDRRELTEVGLGRGAT